MPAAPLVVADPAARRAAVLAARAAGRRVGFVPTMGALHEGHASLVAAAAADSADVVVSVFVNPTQFGPGEDFDRYPRTFAADCDLLAAHGVRWVYAPAAAAVYPPGDATRVVVGGPALGFEGAIRPGHFSGVATVVCRLFLAVPADVAYFGAKDWQQTLVVRRMVADLGLPIEIVVRPTVREADGLALSSRNRYLSAADRGRAPVLAASLAAAAALWEAGAAPADIVAAMRARLDAADVAIDYAAIVDPESLAAEIDDTVGAVALVAGRLGTTRLIDNRLLPPRQAGPR